MKLVHRMLLIYFCLYLFGLLLFWGGLGIYKDYLFITATVYGCFLITLTWKVNHRLIFPKGFHLFVGILLLLILNLLWSVDKTNTITYFKLLFTGCLFWLVSYNLRGSYKDKITRLLIGIGIVFAIYFFLGLVFADSPYVRWSPFFYNRAFNHFHIGDLWVVILVIFVNLSISKFRPWYAPIILLGVILLIISLSRSAYVALVAGAVILTKRNIGKKGGIIIKGLILIVISIFIFAGLLKPTLLERPYYIQAIMGFFKYPLGVGMGNFYQISSIFTNNAWVGFPNLSTYAHNIILEFIAGLGMFGLIFLYWLFRVTEGIWRGSGEVLYKAIFIAITINFMFDYTYVIPTILWIWFVSLGLAQKET